jgi:hypothetical protein
MSIGILVVDKRRGGVQIIGLLIINSAFSIFIAFSKAQKRRIFNLTEIFNEFIV